LQQIDKDVQFILRKRRQRTGSPDALPARCTC